MRHFLEKGFTLSLIHSKYSEIKGTLFLLLFFIITQKDTDHADLH